MTEERPRSHTAATAAVNAERVLSRLSSLVGCPSATDQPSQIAQVILPWLDALGYDITLLPCDPSQLRHHPDYSPPDRTPAGSHDGVLAELPRGDSDLPRLMLFAHTDTEPIHPGWTQPPLELRVDDKHASGLGVADDKAGVVAIIEALEVVHGLALPLRRQPVVVLAPGKQGGALGTLPGTLAAAPVAGAIYAHPAESGQGFAHLKTASRGIVRLQLIVAGHGAVPVEERTPVSADPRQARNPIERVGRIIQSVTGWQDDDKIWAVTRASSGDKPFGVPDRAELELDCWFTSGDPHDIAETVRHRLHELDLDGWETSHPVLVEPIGLRARPATAEGTPLVAEVRRAVAALTGQEPADYAWHSASDIRFPIRALGVPAVGLGGAAGGFYGPGEWVDLNDVHRLAAILAGQLVDDS